MMRILRVYCDTSVFGGCFDEGFSEASIRLFDLVRKGDLILLVSGVTLDELAGAPPRVWELFESLPQENWERVEPSPAIRELRDAYLAAGVVGPASSLDAEHIAAATVGGADMIVSWNFKHIVHYDKIKGYHGVNLIQGYSPIPIHSPPEVI
jgi:hypothetical protein